MVQAFYPSKVPMQADRVRFTISVDEEVHRAFADLADVAGVSLSRCVGDWLRDTAEAAHLTTVQMNEIRRSPRETVRAFLGHEVTPTLLRELAVAHRPQQGLGSGARRDVPAHASSARASMARVPSSPPSSNTGGKVPQDPSKVPVKKARGS